jgi:hypothetical protein
MNIDGILEVFMENLEYIQLFVAKNWGNNILERKNSGEISNSDFNIKNSSITGYAFHGYGCFFKLKDYTIDIEFLEDEVCFKLWNIKSFVNSCNPRIEENEIIEKLSELVSNGILKKYNDYFFLAS